MTEKKKYEKSLEDELDWKLLDQLYGAVVQIGGFCYDVKKLCVTTLTASMVFLTKFSSGTSAIGLFQVSLMIVVGFWLVDSVAYYYQRKLRGLMEEVNNRILKNNSIQTEGLKWRVIDPVLLRQTKPMLVYSSFINSSMVLYYVLLLFVVGAYFVY
ncbi:MAG: hypothetical protein HQL84_00210 [Magnetococcales bacterium]|nr:hypothetical protein [Magnetococcales bacterium]MBF0148451.1 hypothetical protein [Magnetococcales bacterium]